MIEYGPKVSRKQLWYTPIIGIFITVNFFFNQRRMYFNLSQNLLYIIHFDEI